MKHWGLVNMICKDIVKTVCGDTMQTILFWVVNTRNSERNWWLQLKVCVQCALMIKHINWTQVLVMFPFLHSYICRLVSGEEFDVEKHVSVHVRQNTSLECAQKCDPWLRVQSCDFSGFFYKLPIASEFSWKKRSSHQGKKESLWGCGESVNPPKI